MKRLASVLIILGLLGFSASALAQDDEPLAERTIDFTDEIVEGELVRPDGDLIDGIRSTNSRSLITIREEFIDRMIQSAEDL